MFVLSLHMTGANHKTGDGEPDLDVPLILVVICVVQFFTIYLFFCMFHWCLCYTWS